MKDPAERAVPAVARRNAVALQPRAPWATAREDAGTPPGAKTRRPSSPAGRMRVPAGE